MLRDGDAITIIARRQLCPELIVRRRLWFGARLVVPDFFVVAQPLGRRFLGVVQLGPVLIL